MAMKRKPTHPGLVLLKDVILPLGLTIGEAAKDLGVTRKTLSLLVNGKSSVSPKMAIRIAKATRTSPESWLNMQLKLDLWNAVQNEPKNVKIFPNKKVSLRRHSRSGFYSKRKMKEITASFRCLL
jgi:addiction module HigA family antidote